MYPVFFCKYVGTTKFSRYKILTKQVRKAIFLSGFSYKKKLCDDTAYVDVNTFKQKKYNDILLSLLLLRRWFYIAVTGLHQHCHFVLFPSLFQSHFFSLFKCSPR